LFYITFKKMKVGDRVVDFKKRTGTIISLKWRGVAGSISFIDTVKVKFDNGEVKSIFPTYLLVIEKDC